ncbi:MAG: glycosyltransferase family 4 protein [Actinomycetes bacterium]
MFVINSLGAGGAEQSLAEMLPVLEERGLQTSVVCLHRRSEGAQPSVEAGGFDLTFLRSTGWLSRLHELRSLIKSQQPDVVHTAIFEADLLGRGASLGLPCQVVTSLVNTTYDKARLGDPNVTRWKLRAAQTVDSLTARMLTDHFHALTRAVADSSAAALAVSPRLITVVPRGRSLMRLGVPSVSRRRRVRARLGIQPDSLVVLNVGRQEYQKGHRHLIDAFEEVAPEFPKAVLVQAGRSGHASSEISAALDRSRHRSRIEVLGHRDDVPDLMSAADVFAFPSLYEGLGGVLIEAMALGLPIVATRIPAVEEVLEDEGNALLVPPADATAMASALRRLLGDAATRHRFGVRSQVIFGRHFGLDASVDGMMSMYESVVLRRKSRWASDARQR